MNTSLGSPLLFFLLIAISLFHECEYSCPQNIMNGAISITHTFYISDSVDVPVSTSWMTFESLTFCVFLDDYTLKENEA